MTWTNPVVDGTKSVAFNKAAMNNNTAYIETKLQLDHYWDEDANKDGHHKLVEMTAEAADPPISADMDAVYYTKATVEGRNEGWYRNSDGIYQNIPSYKAGNLSITSTSTFVTVTAVPINVYGEIFIYYTGQNEIQHGSFVSDATTVNCFSTLEKIKSNTDSRPRFIEFANGSDASALNIRARRDSGTSGTWYYRVTYRDI